MKSSVLPLAFLALFVQGFMIADAHAGESGHNSGEWSLGAGFAFSTTPYKSYDNRFMGFPLIDYESDRLYIKGVGAGAYLFKNEMHEVSLGASYFAHEFRPSKTDAHELKTLDKRLSTMMANAAYSLTTDIGQFRFKASQDVLGKSDGFIADVHYRLPIIRTDIFGLYPGVGIDWASDKQNDYYYGVSHKEAARGTVRYYNAKNSFTPYVTLEAKYVISDRWEVFAGSKLEFFGNNIKDSPMVDSSYRVGVAAGVQFNF